MVEEDLEEGDTFSERFMDWVRTDLVWYAGSFTAPLAGVVILLLLGNVAAKVIVVGDAPVLEEAKVEKPRPIRPPWRSSISAKRPKEPTRLDTESLTFEKPEQRARRKKNTTTTAKCSSTRAAARPTPPRKPCWAAWAGSTSSPMAPGLESPAKAASAPAWDRRQCRQRRQRHWFRRPRQRTSQGHAGQ